MELHNLTAAPGSNKSNKRIGPRSRFRLRRHVYPWSQGAKSRSGYKHKMGFEGGQMPLQKGVPKFGFKNINRVEYKAINLDALEALAEAQNLTKITVADLRAAGLVPKKALVKILANGANQPPLSKCRQTHSRRRLRRAITAAGGTVSKN